MSVFSKVNEHYTYVDDGMAATGPRVGILESFEVGYEEQTRASAAFGIENELANLEGEQLRKMREAGVADPPFIARSEHEGIGQVLPAGVFDDDYITLARYYAQGGTPETAKRLREYDKRVKEINERFPELQLQTSEQMFDTVRQQAAEYDRRAREERRTIGGYVGEFAGAAAGALSPTSDPFNFITAPVGGFGKSVATRVMGQAGAQSVIETINQITGVQEERRLLGLSHGPLDALARVGGAAVAGAALQGVGEAVAAAGRRWFRSTPSDPAPPPVERAPERTETRITPPERVESLQREGEPLDERAAVAAIIRDPAQYREYLVSTSPLGLTRAGRRRALADLDNVTTQLDQWGGPPPSRLDPVATTALSRYAPPRTPNLLPQIERAIERGTIEDSARRIDPDIMRQYDGLRAEAETLRANIARARASANQELDDFVSAQNAEIDKLAAKAEGETGRRAARTRRQIRERQDAIRTATESAQFENEATRGARLQLVEVDERLRDIAPLVARAVTAARRKWSNAAPEREALQRQIREARSFNEPVADPAPAPVDTRTLYEKFPYFGPNKEGVPVEEHIAKSVDDAAEVLDDGIEAYRASVNDVLNENAKAEPAVPEGHVRVYHGGDPEDAFEAGSGNRWASTSKAYAEDYAGKSEGSLYYVDLPRNDPRVTPDYTEQGPERGFVFNLKLEGDEIAQLKPLTEDAPVSEITLPNGKRIGLDEKIFDVSDDGTQRTVTVRELLKENQDAEYELEAVSLCSVRKPS